jgi:hypothetical protein
VGDAVDVSEIHAASSFNDNPEDRGSKYLRNADNIARNHTV